MKILLIFASSLFLVLCVTDVRGQACGYTFAKFYVTNASGEPVENAKFEFLVIDSDEPAMHSDEQPVYKNDGGHYFYSEGMCGGHRNVRIGITAKGFDRIEHITDLLLTRPADPFVYRVKLKRTKSSDKPSFTMDERPKPIYSFLSDAWSHESNQKRSVTSIRK